MMSPDYLFAQFAGRKLLIATKHQKEKVIAPLMKKALGVDCVIDPSFDSDRFGTFSGEIERIQDPLTTLRNKCLAGLSENECDLVIGSEGSFGPHPLIGLVPADEEWMMLIDQKNRWEITSRTLSLDTNFAGKTIHSLDELLTFAAQVKFPTHALILRATSGNHPETIKGIDNETKLIHLFNDLLKKNGQVHVETDMRAHQNPTRMNVIKELTEKLIKTILSACPNCQIPGFDIVEAIAGLPCSQCGLRTRSTFQHRYQCRSCKHEKIRNFPHGKEQEDPMYCDFCNP